MVTGAPSPRTSDSVTGSTQCEQQKQSSGAVGVSAGVCRSLAGEASTLTPLFVRLAALAVLAAFSDSAEHSSGASRSIAVQANSTRTATRTIG